MDTDYDAGRQAEAAMLEAANADGCERLRWIRVALAWLELARTRPLYRANSRHSGGSS